MINTNDKPIVFDANEVKAALAGDKTQHRIILSSQPVIDDNGWQALTIDGVRISCDSNQCTPNNPIDDAVKRKLPLTAAAPYKVGERLWVQEFHARTDRNMHFTKPHYYADGELTLDDRHDAGLLIKYAASDMPQWASRLSLEVTSVRVERVQDISENDALASGLEIQRCDQGSMWFLNPISRISTNVFHRDEWFGGFSSYWDFLHGKLSFHKNPLVWVIEFKKVSL